MGLYIILGWIGIMLSPMLLGVAMNEFEPESKDDLYIGKHRTPCQFQEMIRQRGYSTSLCCNNCDETVLNHKDNSIYNYCPRCGNHLIHID